MLISLWDAYWKGAFIGIGVLMTKIALEREQLLKGGTCKKEGTKSNHYSCNYDSYIRYWSTKEVIHNQIWQMHNDNDEDDNFVNVSQIKISF